MERDRNGTPAMRELRAVTFDCWGTLIHEPDFQAGNSLRARLLLDLARRRRPQLTPGQAAAALRAAHHRHIERWVRGAASGADEIATWALEGLGIADRDLCLAVAGALAEASLAQQVLPLAGAAETLAELAERRVRIALVCDTGVSPGRVVRRLLERSGLLDHLEVKIFSDEVGVPKPHPRPFLRALAPLGIPPAQAIHVGDLRRTDVAGGREVGMGTVRIRAVHDDPSALPEADHVVDSHGELRALFRTLSS